MPKAAAAKPVVKTIIPIAPEAVSKNLTPSDIPEKVKGYVIKTEDDVAAMKGFREGCKAYETEVRALTDNNISLASKLHKSLIASRDVFLKPVLATVVLIDETLGARELEQRRAKEVREEAARKEQEKERLKVLDAAQKKITKALEGAGKVEDQIAQMQAIVDNPETSEDEQTLALRQIEVLKLKLENYQEAAIDTQKTAERAVEALPVASSASSEGSYTRVKGVSVTLVPEVIDTLALIKLVAEGKAPESILDVNMTVLKALVKAGVKFPADVVKLTEAAKYKGRG